MGRDLPWVAALNHNSHSKPGLFRRLLDRLAGDVEHEGVLTAAITGQEDPIEKDLDPEVARVAQAALRAEVLAWMDSPDVKRNPIYAATWMLRPEMQQELIAYLDQRIRDRRHPQELYWSGDVHLLWRLGEHGALVLAALLFGDRALPSAMRDIVLETMEPFDPQLESVPVREKIALSFQGRYSKKAVESLSSLCDREHVNCTRVAIPALEAIAIGANAKVAELKAELNREANDGSKLSDPATHQSPRALQLQICTEVRDAAMKGLKRAEGVVIGYVDPYHDGHNWPMDAETEALRRIGREV